jgi:hypothetical protein
MKMTEKVFIKKFLTFAKILKNSEHMKWLT